MKQTAFKSRILALFSLLAVAACSGEIDANQEISQIIGIQLGPDARAVTQGFPDRFHHARFEATQAEFDSLINRLQLQADPQAELSWPTVTGEAHWWQPGEGELAIFSNASDEQVTSAGAPLIKAALDTGTGTAFVQIIYEY